MRKEQLKNAIKEVMNQPADELCGLRRRNDTLQREIEDLKAAHARAILDFQHLVKLKEQKLEHEYKMKVLDFECHWHREGAKMRETENKAVFAQIAIHETRIQELLETMISCFQKAKV